MLSTEVAVKATVCDQPEIVHNVLLLPPSPPILGGVGMVFPPRIGGLGGRLSSYRQLFQRDQLNLKEPGPKLSGDKQSVVLCIIGNAVENVYWLTAIFGA